MKFINNVKSSFSKRFKTFAINPQKGFFAFLMAFLISASALAAAPFEPVQIPGPQSLLVIIYGDELTTGAYLRTDQSLAAQLEKRLRRTGFQVNVETVGDTELTSSTALTELHMVLGKAPDLVILQLGETDIKRSLNPKDFGKNMERIISNLKKKGIYVVVMGTKAPKYRGKEYVDEINKVFSTIKKSTPLYPYTLEGIAGNPDMTLGDNYHPNSHGISLIVDGIYSMVDTGLRWKLDAVAKWRQKQLEMRYNH